MCKPATLEGAIRTILTITATAIIFKRHLGRVSAVSDLIGLAVLVVGIFSRWSNMFGLMSYKDCLVDSANTF